MLTVPSHANLLPPTQNMLLYNIYLIFFKPASVCYENGGIALTKYTIAHAMPQKWFFGKFSLSCSVSCKVACHFVCLLWHFWVRFCKYWIYLLTDELQFEFNSALIFFQYCSSCNLEWNLEASYVIDEFLPSMHAHTNSMKHSRTRSHSDLDSSSHYHNVCSVEAEHPIFWPIKPLDNHNTSTLVLLGSVNFGVYFRKVFRFECSW